MASGIIVGITRRPGEGTRLNVQGTGCECRDERQIVVIEGDHRVDLGDCIWWQGGFAYWTPRFHGETESSSRDTQLLMISHT
jgi:hypothetical protein